MMDRTQWPFTDFTPDDPTTIRLTRVWTLNPPSGWYVDLYTMVTGRYGYALGEYDPHGECVERWASGAFDEPWNALENACGELRERLDSPKGGTA